VGGGRHLHNAWRVHSEEEALGNEMKEVLYIRYLYVLKNKAREVKLSKDFF